MGSSELVKTILAIGLHKETLAISCIIWIPDLVVLVTVFVVSFKIAKVFTVLDNVLTPYKSSNTNL